MTRNFPRSSAFRLLCALTIGSLASIGFAQTSTKSFDFTGGNGLSGDVHGDVSVAVKSQSNDGSMQTRGILNVTDLDIDLIRGDNGLPWNFGNIFPDGDARNRTAVTNLDIDPGTVHMNVAATPFHTYQHGTINVTASDGLRNHIVNVTDPGVPGSDGAWDDPGGLGVLNHARLDSFTSVTRSDITAAANLSGGITASIPGDVTIPGIVNEFFLGVDLRVKHSSSIAVDFSDVQNLSLRDVRIDSSSPIALNLPANNFDPNHHPSGVPQADLSVTGIAAASTSVSGTLLADLNGTINANIDLAADINVKVDDLVIFSHTQDFNDVINGAVSNPGASLFSINETVSLSNVALPFAFELEHAPTANPDFDDVVTKITGGTFGFDVPISVAQEAIVNIPTTGFNFGGQSFDVNQGPIVGTVVLENLSGLLNGQIAVDVDADIVLDAHMVATAFEAGAINGSGAVDEVPAPPADAHFVNVTQGDPNGYNAYATGENLLSANVTIDTGQAARAGTDGFFAEDGLWYNIDASENWHAYLNGVDMAIHSNTQASGTSHWNSTDGFFAADGSYYVIDESNTWHQFASAEDLFANLNKLDSGSSFWNYSDGFFAVDGKYYQIDAGNNWRLYGSADDLFNNTNVLATGVSAWLFSDGFAADITAVPEPTTAVLLIAGWCTVALRRRRGECRRS